MEKIIKIDIVIAVILIGTWVYYLMFEGSTRFDISETVTLPLLVAVEFTGVAVLYAAGRYFTAGKSKLISDNLANLMKDQEHKHKGES
ncbi:MAG: hypothetical protein BMS9Abin06_0535 [Gammaproteobacteria bacterium]|nr:MAG: hypothetical protein BMS9Abin06_0535 [Gammaproteobacteria bacterium]